MEHKNAGLCIIATYGVKVGKVIEDNLLRLKDIWEYHSLNEKYISWLRSLVVLGLVGRPKNKGYQFKVAGTKGTSLTFVLTVKLC